MTIHIISAIFLAVATVMSCKADVSLDSCRNMAIANNKQLKIHSTRIKQAEFQRKAAQTAYFPSLDAEASYIYNQKELSLIEHDAKLPVLSLNPATGKYAYNAATGADGKPLIINGQPVPSQVALLPKSALTYDIHNVFAGAVTLTQPLYMGGKILAIKKIAQYAENIAMHERNLAEENVIYNVDVAYWQVISMKAKEVLAQSYVNMLDSMSRSIKAMFNEGIVTNAEVLAVEVKLNQANVDLVKVLNGVSLAHMQLAMLCGLPINTVLVLEDENLNANHNVLLPSLYDMNEVFRYRNDIRVLELAIKVYEQKAKIEQATMLPQVAIVGAYSVTNPNSFNGFKNEFAGMFSIGAMIKIPIWHWGGRYNRYKAAKSETVIRRLELEDAKDKITLQVNQAAYKMAEAIKMYNATQSNLEKAEENLRTAQIGFKEGVIVYDDVHAAQTAWLKAHSEAIDAQIDIRLCNVYLEKVIGRLSPIR